MPELVTNGRLDVSVECAEATRRDAALPWGEQGFDLVCVVPLLLSSSLPFLLLSSSFRSALATGVIARGRGCSIYRAVSISRCRTNRDDGVISVRDLNY